MNRLFGVFVLLLCWLNNTAQLQNNNWRFGIGGGLIFDSSGNVILANGQTSAFEGSTAISDRNTGSLLFYTDGITVWNANDEVMLNGTGLLGGTPELLSSTSAAAIVRDPGSETMYYIFTIDEQSSNNGLRYSIVDMTLDGGLGAIPVNMKNISVLATTSEKIQIVPNADLSGYWVITHDNQEAFCAFELTTSGLSTTPVVSNVSTPQINGAGHMKMNRTFDRLAMGSFFETNISLYDFDNATGVFSNPVIWPYNFGNSLQYGVEFSPNGQVLYVSNLDKIIQYDISSNNPDVIEGSGFEVFVSSFFTGFPASMQLAPDNKIYVNTGGGVGIIACPNFLGAACNWVANAIPNAAFGGYGLHIWSYDIDEVPQNSDFFFTASDNCVDTEITFEFNVPFEYDELNVEWGDGNSDTFTNSVANYTYLLQGNYSVSVEVIRGCENFQFDSTFVVEVCNVDVIDFIILGNLCDETSPIGIQIPLSTTFDEVTINFGDTNSANNDEVFSNVSGTISTEHEFSASGVYEVCVNYVLEGVIDTILCQFVEVGLCCEFEVFTENLCIENPATFSIFGTNDISSTIWTVTSETGESVEYEGLQVSASFEEEGVFLVTIFVEGECGDTTLSRSVTVLRCEKVFCDPFIPNSFTPNNDGINEFFEPIFPCEDIDFELRVYNRWGEKIFDNAQTKSGWNGGINGYYVPDGIYIYEVEYQQSAVNRSLISGNITLLR